MMMQQLNEIKAQAAGTLNRGGEYVYTGPAGHKVKIGYVANGAFCRVEVRDAGGVLVKSHAHQWTHEATAQFGRMVNIFAQAPVAA